MALNGLKLIEVITLNKFYSLLALNSIIDNDLEQNSEEVLELFNIVENTKAEKEQKNLVGINARLKLQRFIKA